MKSYYRPILTHEPGPDTLSLAGGWLHIARVEVMTREGSTSIAPADLPEDAKRRLTAPRAPIAGLPMDTPRIMGIVNTTPDSFSDGGLYAAADNAIAHGKTLVSQGADILDIGGESTRPGADTVDIEEEIARTHPVIAGLADTAPISLDTRKSAVAQGAAVTMINDVSGLTFDPNMAAYAADTGAALCIMHAQGDPKTMQQDPRYDHVLFDVYDALETQIEIARAAGVARDRIVIDPGIGFGKTLDHNLALLRGLSLLHSLGCPILIGASRKRFIGTLSGVAAAQDRVAGSIAVALAAVAQGAHILRVHDVAETRQALTLWQASTGP